MLLKQVFFIEERKFGLNVVMPNIFGIILQCIYHKPTSYFFDSKDYMGKRFLQKNTTKSLSEQRSVLVQFQITIILVR